MSRNQTLNCRPGLLSRCLLLLIVAAWFMPGPAASAQVGPALLLRPWPEGKAAQASTDVLVLGEANSDGPDDNRVRLNWYDGSARYRFDTEAEHSLAVGYDITYIDFTTSDPAIPERLVDQQFAVALPISKWDNWELGAVIGAGYAGNSPFTDSEAMYGRADLIASLKVDEQSSWLFTLNYHGNRSVLPDVPLPAVAYSHALNEQFRYTVGLPFSSLTWQPADKLTIDVVYLAPVSVTATVSYEMLDELTVFGKLLNRYKAFHIDGDDRHRRVFFQQRRVEGGIRWKPCAQGELEFAAGYAFAQELERGWDVRDTDGIREISDEPYVRLGLRFDF